MSALITRLPFQPGRSRRAEWPDGSIARCGMCGGRLELRSTRPALEERDGGWFRRIDYQCADHGGSAGQNFYEPASPAEVAEGQRYKAIEAAARAARMAA